LFFLILSNRGNNQLQKAEQRTGQAQQVIPAKAHYCPEYFRPSFLRRQESMIRTIGDRNGGYAKAILDAFYIPVSAISGRLTSF